MSWWLIELADGSLHQVADAPGTMGNPAGERSAEIPRPFDPRVEAWDWEAGAIVPLLDAWRARLLAQVDAERVARLAPQLSAGEPIQYVYSAKAVEAYNYTTLMAAQVPTMSAEQLAATFPWLSAEAVQLGITLAEQVARVAAARAAADARMQRIEAQAQAAKSAIRTAETLEQMQAAAAVEWEID